VVHLERTEGMEDDEIPIRHRDHGWFGAFAPVDAPEIVVAIFVEHGLHGASAAAPVAQRILARYFEKKAENAEKIAVSESALGADLAVD
jgi:penicillin-binding protein 2